MPKLTVSLATGAALTCAAALAVVAPVISGSIEGTGAVALVSSTTALKTVSVAPAVRVAEVKPVRSVVLRFPIATNDVGTNVTGSIQVIDTVRTTATSVPGAAVALQQKRGNSYVTVSDGVTDENGFFAVTFTSRVNATWRAELTPETGAKKLSKTVATIASASANWAARPAMDVVHGVPTSYSFRVGTDAAARAHLEIASSKSPTRWIPMPATAVPATGVVTQSEKFPTAGTWLLRGATTANPTNGAGYTTAISITVS
jgi:hypothetical protein